MDAARSKTWGDAHTALWARIQAHDFEPQGATNFTQRFAREHGWSLDMARAAIEEYRRFCFLGVVAGHEVTPSQEVDEVWHLHLTYSRDYWDRWCAKVLQTSLHHNPTQGGSSEHHRFAQQYAQTLAAYEMFFGMPPKAFWPGTGERFGTARFRTVDLTQGFFVSAPSGLLRGARSVLRRFFLVAALMTLPKSANALPMNPIDWPAEPYLIFQATLSAVALGILFAYRTFLRRAASTRKNLSIVELACLAGGRSRAGDAAIVYLLNSGQATLAGPRTIRLDAAAPLPFSIHLKSGVYTRLSLIKALQPYVTRMRDGLARDGLLLTDKQIGKLLAAALLVVGPVLLFGFVKMGVGSERGKPVGFLFAMEVATAVIAVMMTLRGRTDAGDARVQQALKLNERASRAPLGSEIPLAFALIGATVLSGTALASYGTSITSNSGGGCGGGDGGGSCGGGGGGGCGGCGGGD